jgi:Zinc finger C-x8-C-x5-C-x3-H type (and similar)
MPEESLYQRCLPILEDSTLDDDDRAEKIEQFVRAQTPLSGKELENSVLDILWRFRAASSPEAAAARPASRITVIKKAAPAPWQIARVPTPSQSLPKTLNPSLSASPSFIRSRSNAASPFASPRASPRLAFAAPYIPHSPRLDAYQPGTNNPSPTHDVYGDLGNDSVEWLVGDDVVSNASSLPGDVGLSGSEYSMGPGQMLMDPYDMLRSVFGDELSNESLEKALEENGYDIASTMSALMESHGFTDSTNAASSTDLGRTVLIGKSMSPAVRPATPVGQQKCTIVCRYWLATGQCARADCKFSHDTTTTVCKYVKTPHLYYIVHLLIPS